MFNASMSGADYALPSLKQGYGWHLAVDTSCEAQKDLFAAGEEPISKDIREPIA